MKKTYPLFLLLLNCSLFSAQNRYHVHPSAVGGAGNGASWADAFTSLHNALAIAGPGDSVWVAAGVYYPATGPARDSSFVLRSGTRLFGGFAGTETDIAQRDWANNPTVLSGDIGIKPDSTDNAYTILYHENPDSGTVVDGLVFRHGIADNADGNLPADSPRKCGGAIYIMAADGWAYPDIRNCLFEHNYAFIAGGAIYINGSGVGSVAPRVLNCVFRLNTARLDGGAVYKDGASWVERVPDFGHCTFEENKANRRGGGLMVSDRERSDTIHLIGCQFIRNRVFVQEGGGAAFAFGRLTGSKLSVDSCYFFENSGKFGSVYSITSFNSLFTAFIGFFNSGVIKNFLFGGGGSHFWEVGVVDVPGMGQEKTYDGLLIDNNFNGYLFILGGSVFQSTFTKTSLTNCNVKNNTGGFIGSIGGEFDSMYITGNVIVSTDTFPIFTLKRAGIKILDYDHALNFSNNICLAPNGTIFDAHQSSVTLQNNHFQAKTLLFEPPGQVQDSLNFRIYNSVLQSSGQPELFIRRSDKLKATFSHCLIDTTWYCDNLPNVVTCGPGNLFGLDPLLRDTAAGDFSPLPCSPLFDAGNKDYIPGIQTDIEGKPRVVGAQADIGPFEAPGLGYTHPPDISHACGPVPAGAVGVHPANGCEPYQFTWSAGQGDSTLAGLAPGTYFLTLSDARGRIRSDTFTVDGSDPAVSITGDSLLCGAQADGRLQALLSGDVRLPVVFDWSTGASDTAISGLPAGAYVLTITDAAGCRDTATATVLNVPPPAATFTVQNASAVDSMDGRIAVAVSGGISPFVFVWNTGDSTVAISGLKPGAYTLVLYDGAGCNYGYVVEVGFSSSIGQAPFSQAAGYVYPNPVNDVLHIHWEEEDQWRLFDALGRQVLEASAGAGENTLGTDRLAPGVYAYVFYRNGKPVQAGRVVKW